MKSTTLRKKLANFVLPFFFGALLLSCEGGRLDTEAVSRAVEVSAVREGIQTRVTDGMWDPGDAIGLFMKSSGAQLSEASVLARNVKYVTSGGINFLPADESVRILFPFNTSNVDFIGYYPFTTELDGFNVPVDVSDQSDLSAIALLYSNNATGLSSRSPVANLTFRHQLTKIVLNIRPENPATILNGLTVRLTNAGTSASFSLVDGTLSAPTTHGDIPLNVSADGRSAQAIVLPAGNLTGMHLALNIGDLQYVFPLSGSTNIASFDAGTRYTFNITLNPQGVGVLSEGSITNWIEGGEEDITLDPCEYGVPDMTKGTRENPFTIEEARANSGSTNVWVKGYIVGFYSTTTNAHANFVNNLTGLESDGISQANLALATDVNEIIAVNTLPVMLGSGTIRNRLNLRANPENFGKKVIIRGTIGNYLQTIGLREITEFEFVEE